MWVSKKEYEKLEHDCVRGKSDSQMWQAKYEAVVKDRVTYSDGAAILSMRMLNDLRSQGEIATQKLREVEAELAAWKQKYADEVQKRLTLIEQLGAQTA